LESSSCFLPSAGVDPCDELIQLSPSSCGSGFPVNDVCRMICSMWQRTEEEAINRRTPRAKGRRIGPGVGWAGRPRPVSAQVSSPVASRVIPYLCALACGPLTSFLSWLRLESLLSKLRRFLVESLKTYVDASVLGSFGVIFIVCLDSCRAS
jgi:hypothetical protein